MQKKFDEAATPRTAPVRPKGAPLSVEEEELTDYRLESVKRLFLFLNSRLERSIEQWKELQGASDSPEKTRASVKLSGQISDGRRAVEEALQMMIGLAPQGVPATPSMTMGLSFRARFQGTPVSTLKDVAVSQNWIQTTLAPKDDPLRVSLGSGPAQQWRLRFAAPEDNAVQSSDSGSSSLTSAVIASAFKKFDVDNSKKIDVTELSSAVMGTPVELAHPKRGCARRTATPADPTASFLTAAFATPAAC